MTIEETPCMYLVLKPTKKEGKMVKYKGPSSEELKDSEKVDTHTRTHTHRTLARIETFIRSRDCSHSCSTYAVYLCFTYALLMLYLCFTHALLMLYLCFTHALLVQGGDLNPV